MREVLTASGVILGLISVFGSQATNNPTPREVLGWQNVVHSDHPPASTPIVIPYNQETGSFVDEPDPMKEVNSNVDKLIGLVEGLTDKVTQLEKDTKELKSQEPNYKPKASTGSGSTGTSNQTILV